MQHPVNILERYWNFTSFKPLQEDIINAVITGEDTFALLPTGGGKSLCFQIPALAKEGICIVISPLIALMKNQVQALQDKGIKAMALTSGISYKDLDTMLDNCIYGKYKFLYLSPERLQQDIVKDRIRQMNVNLIAVDEAHCISQWGNDFRPSYKNIAVLRELQPTANVIALTASATPEVVEDIVSQLDFIAPKIFKQSFARPNLAYMVFTEEDKFYRLVAILKKNKASSIIYVRNRKATFDISRFLEHKGFTATNYHGGLSNKEKDEAMDAWINNRKQVMVATNAFGMGIDKPDVKTVIHLNLPESIESYFQEAGRAGRNGDKAFAVILKDKNDEALVEKQFLNVLPTVDFIKLIYKKLSSYFQVAYGEGEFETFDFNFNDFCKTYKFNTIIAYNALLALDRTSIITLSKQFKKKTLIQVVTSNASLFNYLETHPGSAIIVKTILRTYGGVFEQETKINTLLIAEKTGIPEFKVISNLEQLEKAELITLQNSKTDAQITYLQPREDDKSINRISTVIKQQNSLRQHQVRSVLNYISNDTICKSVQLLSYFGEKNVDDCGVCNVCLQKKKAPKVDAKSVKHGIIELLETSDLSSRALAEQLPFSEQDIQCTLTELLEYEIIKLTKTNTYKLAHI
ncbi:RecQ family ATP-dependent DNA helicase [Bizionia gelidisalsuginis]|uniref:ATP-dependent DNA helicase RecQ n=2 Tax=Bizionia TaxID=283785 RepID=A0A8H2QJY5_9FLAO|nr:MULTISPECIES: RecQ family ATP-dependent DNA helicase [Bizionia]TYB76796.1 RecQ family ATP-dependent DNA helicase [Bizionia saleffrena]TYC12028.1 RecQ family ATP-dependent DNA helicase [Bizionia gelidisalsuginis]